MDRIALLAPVLLLTAQAAPPAPQPSPGEIVAASPTSDWVDIEARDLLVMDLAPDARGKPRQVVIQLMPRPFSQGWIGNIRKLAAAHWWDGTSINRVQDNYVVQWGDATEKKALPKGLATVSTIDYETALFEGPLESIDQSGNRSIGLPVIPALSAIPADSYSRVGFFDGGWPVATDSMSHRWPTHCYGMVGVGRDMPPNTGTGAELYTVIGHAPRHLDRNIALVGRVIAGIEHLSSLPRGTEALGFYKTPEERTAIKSIRLASEMEADPGPRFQYLSTESATFARYADARANRRDPFFIKPAGGADICNIPVPIRKKP